MLNATFHLFFKANENVNRVNAYLNGLLSRKKSYCELQDELLSSRNCCLSLSRHVFLCWLESQMEKKITFYSASFNTL